MKDLVYSLEMRRNFFKFQKFDRVNFKPGIVYMMREMLASPGGEIIQNPDLLGGCVG